MWGRRIFEKSIFAAERTLGYAIFFEFMTRYERLLSHLSSWQFASAENVSFPLLLFYAANAKRTQQPFALE